MPDKSLKDITSIPYFAYEPGITEWICLILFCIFAVIFLRFIFRIKNNSRNFKALDKAISELIIISAKEIKDPKETAFNTSILARRLVSYIYDPQVSTLSETELSSRAAKSPDKISKILNAIVELEKIKYSPDIIQDSVKSSVNALLKALQDYRQGEISQ